MNMHTSILDVSKLLISTKPKERTEAIKTLQQFIQVPKNLDSFSSNAVHKLIECLFNSIQQDVYLYSNSTQSSVLSQSEDRLRSASNIVRTFLTSNRLTSTLKFSSIKLFLNHLYTVLPQTRNINTTFNNYLNNTRNHKLPLNICAPISINYIKSLKFIIENSPQHIEHLSKKQWIQLVLFITETIERNSAIAHISIEDLQHIKSSQNSSVSSQSSISNVNTNSNSIFFNFKNSISSSFPFSLPLPYETIELMGILASLLSFPVSSLALTDDIPSIVTTTYFLFLNSHPQETPAHQYAFKSLSILISLIRCENLNLLARCVLESLPLLPDFWRFSSTGRWKPFYTELLNFTTIILDTLPWVYSQFIPSSQNTLNDDIKVNIQKNDLINHSVQTLISMRNWYLNIPLKNHLEIDDLLLTDEITSQQIPYIFYIGNSLRLKLNPFGNYHAWIILRNIASLDHFINSNVETQADEISQYKDSPSSSHILTTNDSKKLLTQKQTDFIVTKLCKMSVTSLPNQSLEIQLLTFQIALFRPSLELNRLMPIMKSLIGTLNVEISAWSLLFLSFVLAESDLSVLENQFDDKEIKPILENIWVFACRYISIPNLSRVSCIFISTCLSKSFVDDIIALHSINNLLSIIEASGPSSLCDASIKFWCSLIAFKQKFPITDTDKDSLKNSIISWLILSLVSSGSSGNELEITTIEDGTKSYLLTTQAEICDIIDFFCFLIYNFEYTFRYTQFGLLKTKYFGIFANLGFTLKCDVSLAHLLLNCDGSNLNSTTEDNHIIQFHEKPNQNDNIKNFFALIDLMNDTSYKLSSRSIKAQKFSEYLMLFLLCGFILKSDFFGLTSTNNKVKDFKERYLSAFKNLYDSLIEVFSLSESTTFESVFIKTFSYLIPYKASSTIVNIPFHSLVYELTRKVLYKINKERVSESNFNNSYDGDDNNDEDDIFQFSDLKFKKKRKTSALFLASKFPSINELKDSFRTLFSIKHSVKSYEEQSIFYLDYLYLQSDLNDRKDQLTELLLTLAPENFIYVSDMGFQTDMELHNASFIVSLDDNNFLKILNYITENFITNYYYERCEYILCLTLKICFAKFNQYLDNSASHDLMKFNSVIQEVSQWLIDIGLHSNSASTYYQMAIGEFIIFLLKNSSELKLEAEWANELDSNFSNLITSNSIRVKYALTKKANQLIEIWPSARISSLCLIYEKYLVSLETSALFNLFIMKTFNINVEMFYFFIKGITEQALIDTGTEYCSMSIETVSSYFDISAKCLFSNYSSEFIQQVLSHENGLELFKFHLFGYSDFLDFYYDNETEIIAQLYSFYDIPGNLIIQNISTKINTQIIKIIRRSFAKLIAYVLIKNLNKIDYNSIALKLNKYYCLNLKDEVLNNISGVVGNLIACITFDFQKRENLTQEMNSNLSNNQETIHRKSISSVDPQICSKINISSDQAIHILESLSKFMNSSIEDLLNPAGVLFSLRIITLRHLHTIFVHEEYNKFKRISFHISILGQKNIIHEYIYKVLIIQICEFLTKKNLYCAVEEILDSLKKFLSLNLQIRMLERKDFQIIFLGTFEFFLQQRALESKCYTYISKFLTNLKKYKENQYKGFFYMIEKSPLLNLLYDILITSSNSAKVFELEESLLDLFGESNHSGNDDTIIRLGLRCCAIISTEDFNLNLNDISSSTCCRIASYLISYQVYLDDKAFIIWASEIIGKSYLLGGPSISCNYKEVTSFCTEKIFINNVQLMPFFEILQILLNENLVLNSTEISYVESFLRFLYQGDEKNNFVSTFLCHDPHINLALSSHTAFVFNEFDPINNEFKKDICNNRTDSIQCGSLKKWAMHRSVECWHILQSCTDQRSKNFFSGLINLLRIVPSLSIVLYKYIFLSTIIFSKNFEFKILYTNFYSLVLNDNQKIYYGHAKLLLSSFFFSRLKLSSYDDNILKKLCDHTDFENLANISFKYGMFQTAYFFAEFHWSLTKNIVKILENILRQVTDPDLIYGINVSPSISNYIDRSVREGNYWDSLYCSNLVNGIMDADISISSALHNVGLYNLSIATNQYFSNLNINDHVDLYSSAWKNHCWDLPVKENSRTRSEMIYYLFCKLKYIPDFRIKKENFLTKFLLNLNQEALGKVLKLSSFSSIQEYAPLLSITHMAKNMLQKLSKIENDVDTLWKPEWMEYANIRDFEDILIAQKEFRHFTYKLTSRYGLAYKYCSSVCILNKLYREHNQNNKTLNLLLELKGYKENNEIIDRFYYLEAAKFLWEKNEMLEAIKLLKLLIKKSDVFISEEISKYVLLVQLGTWVSLAKQEKVDIMMNTYFEDPIAEIMENEYSFKTQSKAFHQIARFYDAQLYSESNNNDFERMKLLRNNKQAEIKQLKEVSLNLKSQTEKKKLLNYMENTKKLYKFDEKEYDRLSCNREIFLAQSLYFYLRSLEYSDSYPDDVMRFCIIWFANSQDFSTSEMVMNLITKVPTRNFVPLVNQLSSRLLQKNGFFQMVLQDLIYQICIEHPYHVLYQLFSLKQSVKLKSPDENTISRSEAAFKIWERLKVDSNFTKNFLIPIETFCEKSISLANIKIDSKSNNIALNHLDGGRWWLNQYKELKIPIPTTHIPVTTINNYKMLPSVISVNSILSIASGLSRPKILSCTTNDGKEHKILFKSGNDDLRQDAIMEQVFDQVNEYLSRNKDSRIRNLLIRTYKVVPLGPKAGLIEFVSNTISLCDYLVKTHKKYYPNEWSMNKARMLMKNSIVKGKASRLDVFNEIEKNIHPVLHHFFLDNFLTPEDWYKSRINYSRNTATISIVGYILGIGDRHTNNILLDSEKGDPVHIDFGISFELGKTLPVPETVPFRLSRDIVDGMGILGLDGPFRRCCEITLKILRQEKEKIHSILEVFKHDPIYSWTITPLRKKKIQDEYEFLDSGKTETNSSEAERALVVISQKLSESLSINATVNSLIQEATDSSNLASMYYGWCPFY